MFQLCVVGNTEIYGIPNRRIQLEITVAQTYANNKIGNDYYSSAVVHILYVKLLYQGGLFFMQQNEDNREILSYPSVVVR